MATKTAKQVKQVVIIARAEFKSDPKKVCYQVRSSNGVDTYWTCLYNSVATSCQCDGNSQWHKKCCHMAGCEKLEAERTAKAAREAQVEKLDGNDALVSVTAAELIAQETAKADVRKAETAEIKAAVFQVLKQQFDYRSAAPVAPAPAQPIATRGTLNPQKAFSLLR